MYENCFETVNVVKPRMLFVNDLTSHVLFRSVKHNRQMATGVIISLRAPPYACNISSLRVRLTFNLQNKCFYSNITLSMLQSTKEYKTKWAFVY
jgi:hypothetical protein